MAKNNRGKRVSEDDPVVVDETAKGAVATAVAEGDDSSGAESNDSITVAASVPATPAAVIRRRLYGEQCLTKEAMEWFNKEDEYGVCPADFCRLHVDVGRVTEWKGDQPLDLEEVQLLVKFVGVGKCEMSGEDFSMWESTMIANPKYFRGEYHGGKVTAEDVEKILAELRYGEKNPLAETPRKLGHWLKPPGQEVALASRGPFWEFLGGTRYQVNLGCEIGMARLQVSGNPSFPYDSLPESDVYLMIDNLGNAHKKAFEERASAEAEERERFRQEEARRNVEILAQRRKDEETRRQLATKAASIFGGKPVVQRRTKPENLNRRP